MEEEVKSLRKKLKIYSAVIAFLTVLALTFLMFAFILRAESKKQEELANMLAARAQESATEALKQKDITEQARLMAERQKIEAEQFAKRTAEKVQQKK